jgi:hypothetical protein
MSKTAFTIGRSLILTFLVGFCQVFTERLICLTKNCHNSERLEVEEFISPLKTRIAAEAAILVEREWEVCSI